MDAAQPAGGPKEAPPPGNAQSPHATDAAAAGQKAGSGSPEAANDGVLDSAQALWRDFTALAKDHLELALLETQRAGKSAVNMLVYAIGAALLLVTAWLALLAAIVLGLAELGLHPAFGALIVVGLNVAGAYVLYRMIRKDSENLRFPATVRSFSKRATAAANAEGRQP